MIKFGSTPIAMLFSLIMREQKLSIVLIQDLDKLIFTSFQYLFHSKSLYSKGGFSVDFFETKSIILFFISAAALFVKVTASILSTISALGKLVSNILR